MADHHSAYRILLIGGSAGSLEVVLPLIESLKESFYLPIIIVVHRKTDSDGFLSQLLSKRSGMTVKEAEDKEQIQNRTIYIAPADYHLLIEKDHSLSLDFSEKIHYSRPSIDATFETAAEAYGTGAIGILLSGANDDGMEGIKAIQKAGGLTIVQDPSSAMVSYMPDKAIQFVKIDHVLTQTAMTALINRIC